MKSEDKEVVDVSAEFQNIFSLKKPKDLRAGASSAAKSVAKGVLAGTIGLVAAPLVGAHQEGLKGFAKGAAAGLAGAVILPVTGVAVGTAQLIRGAVNTPEAFKASQLGYQWDEDQRLWIESPGTALALEDTAAKEVRAQMIQAATSSDDLYIVLGVSRHATLDEIRKAYYLLARQLHPDKNPGDATAHARFQSVGEAYQVLGSPELRAKYDVHGKDALDVNFVDSSQFFSALFGSDNFEHLIGELALAAAAKAGKDLTAVAMKKFQSEREDALVVNLKALLLRYVVGDEVGFRDAMMCEARELSQASFGPTLLHTIGRSYKSQANIVLGGFFDGGFAAIKSKGRTIKSQFGAASLALKVYSAQMQIQKIDEAEKKASTGNADRSVGGDVSVPDIASQRAALEEKALPLMLEAMWAANTLDIEATLRHVCRRVLKDEEGPVDWRLKRAEGLRLLGEIFVQAAAEKATAEAPSNPEEKQKQARKHMEEAMMHVMEKNMRKQDGS